MLASRGPAHPRLPAAGFAALGLVAGTLVGALLVRDLALGAAVAGAVALLAVVLVRPIALAVVALAGVYASYRLGGSSVGGSGISYSDAALALATVTAVLSTAGSAELHRLRLALAGVAIYLATLGPTIAFNPSHRAYLEWLHRLVLMGGSLTVGAWIVQERAVRTALRALAAVTAVVAVAAVGTAVTGDFAPASPFGLNKNLVGALLGIVFVVLVVAPGHFEIGPALRVPAVVITAAGLLASQSRGGMLGAAAGLLLAYALDPRGHSRASKVLAGVATVVFAAFVVISVRDELDHTKSEIANSSIGVRFNVERVTREVWRTSPTYGVGLKYFTTGAYGPGAQAANNVVDNELAESGVIGLLGFVVLQGGVAWAGVRRRRGDPLVIAGVSCVVGQLVHGMVDIYWTAGVASLPLLVLGMGLAGVRGQPDGKTSEFTSSRTRVHS